MSAERLNRSGESVTYRRACSQDAEGVRVVAHAVSYSNIRAQGVDEEALSRGGFLLYPLTAANDNEPNYRERIEASKHFWVAEQDKTIIGFLMAYTFDCMNSFANKTDNDKSTLEHFSVRMGIRGSAIYCAQFAVLPEYQKQGVLTSLGERAFGDIDGANHPAVIGEVAQTPIWNESSTHACIANGLTPLFLREKADTNSPGERRLSATFVRMFPCRQKTKGPVVC
jgi:GNAT superfamily N-acetyltransferase